MILLRLLIQSLKLVLVNVRFIQKGMDTKVIEHVSKNVQLKDYMLMMKLADVFPLGIVSKIIMGLILKEFVFRCVLQIPVSLLTPSMIIYACLNALMIRLLNLIAGCVLKNARKFQPYLVIQLIKYVEKNAHQTILLITTQGNAY